ncbi:hypothetical protein AB0F13_27700 [Streptomyces sp. NPDC026206]|uniref:hypothetical protein n=1 Tax=Streptomyces sp. NPDC026206 TaxID=3157089 RepID=UPI0033D87B4B
MTMVKIRLPEDRLDITALNVSFADLPVASASVELVRGFGGDLEELGESLLKCFADGASWCRVGNAVHTVTHGDAEVRLVPRSDTPAWHVDYFQAGWGSSDGARIPPEFRPEYARYVDRRHKARESCLEGEDLRAVAAKDGAGGVDKLVWHHRAQLTEWYDALDNLLHSVPTASSLPEWATSVARDELLDWHRTPRVPDERRARIPPRRQRATSRNRVRQSVLPLLDGLGGTGARSLSPVHGHKVLKAQWRTRNTPHQRCPAGARSWITPPTDRAPPGQRRR